MVSDRNISQKDKEDALLFKEFIYLLHTTENSLKKNYDNEADSVELNMGSSCQSIDYKSDNSEHNSNISDSYSQNKFGNQNSDFISFKTKNLFFDNEKKELSNYNYKSNNYFEGKKESFKNDSFHFNEPDQGFICAYCESKYIYKRCLINHLLKSHRKLIKNNKYNNSFDL